MPQVLKKILKKGLLIIHNRYYVCNLEDVVWSQTALPINSGLSEAIGKLLDFLSLYGIESIYLIGLL